MDYNSTKIITCHLGNGASITAIEHGKSIDTSMGFTPVDGLIMGTRTGEVDPGVLLYLADKEELSVGGVSNLINKKSGVFGISQLSSDMRDLEAAAGEGNPKAILALNMYAYKIKKFIGAYVAAMNGLDLLVFTAGVGENDCNARKMICTGMEFLGIEIDDEINRTTKARDQLISVPSSKVKVIVVTTDEEFVIASDTKLIVEKLVH
jgi:acetate kinase